jgi:pterin-4a-carbinolamine dehydratase
MTTNQNVQELKAERVQEERAQREALARMRKRLAGQDAVGAAMARTKLRAAERLKAERVQLRLTRLPGWKMPAEGVAIDRVRRFEDPLVAAAYLAFASLLARTVGQPLQVSLSDGNIIIALTGRTKGADKGITDEVLNLAEQLG